MLFEWIPVTRAEQNCAILWCAATRKAAVIDPGGDIHLITDFLEWEALNLDIILITHGHFDHAGGAAQLAAKTGARIAGPHLGDAHLLANMADHAKSRGFNAQNFTPDRWLQDGDHIHFGEQELKVLHCPGHSAGHVAYFHRQRRQAFVGDILFRHAIGAWQHPDGDLAVLINSIRGKLFPLGDDVSFLPGHGAPSSFGRERRENPFVGDKNFYPPALPGEKPGIGGA
jgi:glyoxylase-like metal-dependent hydrolase (beta-lactamase superfamily II)